MKVNFLVIHVGTSQAHTLNSTVVFLRMLFITYQILTLPKEPISTVEGLGCISSLLA